MTQQSGGPVSAGSRISQLDVIRGFALFGVLWINLYEHTGIAIPEDHVILLAPKHLEDFVRFLSVWLMIGKGQALFSMLFGFGFALFLDRAEQAGKDSVGLYLRRACFLLALGLAHAWLLWFGDILNSYALMAFLLVLTRRWPGWLLLGVGAPLAILAGPLLLLIVSTLHPGQPPSWVPIGEAGVIRRFPVFMGHNYPLYIVENVRDWYELHSTALGPTYLGWIFGRFLIGQWLYRTGWVQNAARYTREFRVAAAILLPLGLFMALMGPLATILRLDPHGLSAYLLLIDGRASQVVLALGYAAGIMVLCQFKGWRQRLSGLGAVGQMALTNYLTQSFVFVFLLTGFGLRLLPYVGPVFCLSIAIALFSTQIAFSRWWLTRYRFGPMEWVWRCFTYGALQPMRKAPQAEAAGAIA
jgi:uncharacterized protein